jgi:hypothetical protein
MADPPSLKNPTFLLRLDQEHRCSSKQPSARPKVQLPRTRHRWEARQKIGKGGKIHESAGAQVSMST